jgi:hypothetical protein
MNRQLARGLLAHAVSLAVALGSRIDDAALVSVGGGTSGARRLYWNGPVVSVRWRTWSTGGHRTRRAGGHERLGWPVPR